MESLLRTALRPHIVRNASRISLVVGTVLNLINQGHALWVVDDISVPHLILNYVVPYCVASYSAAKNERSRIPESAP